MNLKRSFEQHIAVFGESGSGKTVLLSSFYGATQEPDFPKKSVFDVIADQSTQGTRLHQNYLGMKNSRVLPEANRFAATSYSFSVVLKDADDAKAQRGRPFDALRLVWHDYPGEWFGNDVSGPEEEQRKVDTFKALLESDVALLLVDAQKLRENAGAEQAYLKSMFNSFTNELRTLKGRLLEDGKPLVKFPRIWMFALSKSDLLPDMEVTDFRDLLTEKAGGEINELRTVVAGLVEGTDALSVGEDLVLLSSAKFDADRIEVTERVGIEMILALAAVLPIERHARWAQRTQVPRKVVEHLLRSELTGFAARIATMIRRNKVPGRVGWLLDLATADQVANAMKAAGDKLKELNKQAQVKHDLLIAMLTGFRLDLENGEKEKTLLRSRK